MQKVDWVQWTLRVMTNCRFLDFEFAFPATGSPALPCVPIILHPFLTVLRSTSYAAPACPFLHESPNSVDMIQKKHEFNDKETDQGNITARSSGHCPQLSDGIDQMNRNRKPDPALLRSVRTGRSLPIPRVHGVPAHRPRNGRNGRFRRGRR